MPGDTTCPTVYDACITCPCSAVPLPLPTALCACTPQFREGSLPEISCRPFCFAFVSSPKLLAPQVALYSPTSHPVSSSAPIHPFARFCIRLRIKYCASKHAEAKLFVALVPSLSAPRARAGGPGASGAWQAHVQHVARWHVGGRKAGIRESRGSTCGPLTQSADGAGPTRC